MGHFEAAKQVVLWESLWITSSKGRAFIPVYRQGTVKLMAMTDGSVMPSSRTQTMRELLHPTLLPGVTAHPAKPRTQGQQEKCQFVTHCSSGSARLIEKDGGTCELPVAPWWGKAAFLAKRQHRWLQMAALELLQRELPELFWRHPV